MAEHDRADGRRRRWPRGQDPRARQSPRARRSGSLAPRPSASRIRRVTSRAVGAAARLAHDRPDQRPDRLRVAGRAPARPRPGRRRSPARRSPRARRRRRAPRGHARRRSCAGRRPRRRARRAPRAPRSPSSVRSATIADERGRAPPARARARGRVLVADARHQLAADPVGEPPRVRCVGARSARSKKSPSSARKASWRARSALSAQLALEALGARRRQLAASPRAPPRASPRWSRSEPGRARGSSGSRAPPPWSAASVIAPVGGIEVQRLLHHLPAGLDDRPLALDLRGDSALEKAERVHVLQLRLGPERRRCPPGAATRWRRPAASPRPCSRRSRRARGASRAAARATRAPAPASAGRAR